MFKGKIYWIICILEAIFTIDIKAQNPSIREESFFEPDSSYYPGVIWWWLRCPTTKAAITKDLEEMKDKRISSLLLFDFGTGGGQKRMPEYLEVASDEWNELVSHSIKECSRLGLEFGICISCAGMSAPWIKPEDSQQKLVFSKISVEGGENMNILLPIPDNVQYNSDGNPVCYQDISVIAIPDTSVVGKSEAINVNRYFGKDGVLRVTLPKGKWQIFRFGFTNTNRRMNEFIYIDELRKDLMESYYSRYFGSLFQNLSKEEKKSVTFIVADSWEAGISGWTPDFQNEFMRRNGYDIIKYLPTLAGVIIENEDFTNRVLFDYRQTIAALIAEHYAYFQQIAHRDGLKTMVEASGPHQDQADGLLCQKFSDVPMGEFWARAKTHRISLKDRILTKEAASSGHIYGKRVISAESFTTVGPQWEEDPFFLKPTADRAFCDGINRIYFHNYPHSPSLTARPGYVYYAGTYINRNVTWWNYSLDWFKYLARNQYMLQQGLPVADVCFYYGPGIENRITYKQDSARINNGYQYDYVNSDVILTRMSVRNHRIFLPDGVSYALMVMPDDSIISLNILKKVQELVKSGATILGPRPKHSNSLINATENDFQIRKISKEMWGNANQQIVDRKYGKGRVISGKKIDDVLESISIEPDISIYDNSGKLNIDFIHRKNKDNETYYIANLDNKEGGALLSFRITGKIPQIWNPVDGSVSDVNVYYNKNGRIIIPCVFVPYDSFFIVFKDGQASATNSISVEGANGTYGYLRNEAGEYTILYSDGRKIKTSINRCSVSEINTPWDVDFDTDLGGPGLVVFDSLYSWTSSKISGIKYYSGTATYTNSFCFDGFIDDKTKIILDLGELYNVAEISINGKLVGTCWMKPFQIDISKFVNRGDNKLEIKVANLWPNRLIGDQLLDERDRITKTNISKFTKDDKLRPSGLLGPVKLKKY